MRVHSCLFGLRFYPNDMNIFDAHAHIASWPTLEESKSDLLLGMLQHNIEASLISNADCATFPSERKRDVPSLSAASGLRIAIEFAREYPGKIYCGAWLTPRREKVPSNDLVALIEDNLDVVKCLKLHPFCERMSPDDPRMDPYYDLAERLNLPVLIHTALDPDSSIGRLVAAAKARPNVRFVAAHLELCSNHLYAIDAIADLPNVYCDTAWVEMNIAKNALETLGPGRVFFGTDAPVDGSSTLDHPFYRAYFENAEGMDETSYEALMRENAKTFYKIP